jgi:hypothetical protein
MYNSIVRGLENRNLSPLKGTSQIRIRVARLAYGIEAISLDVEVTPHAGIYNDNRHDIYHDLRFKLKIVEVMKSIPNPALESHIRHMALQGEDGKECGWRP